MSDTRRQRGFVMVATLVMIALAAVVLASSARRNLTMGLTALSAEQDLQRRWAVTTLHEQLLPEADQLLEAAAEEADEPVASVRRQITLSGMRHELVLSDEQAKLNVAALLTQRSRDQTQEVLRELIAPWPDPLRLRLLDAPPQTFAQVFEAPSPQKLMQIDFDQPEQAATGPATLITLWGDGRLNLWRASEPSIIEAVRPILSTAQARRLAELAQAYGTESLEEVLGQLELTEMQAAEMRERLTLDSRCYSLWVVSHNDKRHWHSVHARQLSKANDGDPQNHKTTAPSARTFTLSW